MEGINDKLAKKIRRILLINVDNEIRKKKRSQNIILINSMTPLQLENKFLQLKEEPMNTPTSYFTNLSEKFLVERVVDNKRKINYFYSDGLGKQGMLLLNKNPKNFFAKYSAENLKMNLGMFLHEEEEKTQTQSTKDSNKDYVPLYSLDLHKKNIVEYKSTKYLMKFQDIEEEPEQFDVENEQSNQQLGLLGEKAGKFKKSNYKFQLINFCFTRLKKKISKTVSLDPNSKRPTMKEENKQEKITIGQKEMNQEEIATDKIEKKKIKKKKNLFSLFHKIQNEKESKEKESKERLSKEKLSKESNETKETKDNEDINNLIKYKSTKTNGLINKLKDIYENNNKNHNNRNKDKDKDPSNDNILFRKTKRTVSQIKVNKKFLKLNTENDLGKGNEGLKVSNKKEKTCRTKTNKKIFIIKSTTDVKSNFKFLSPDKKVNKYRVSNKFRYKKSHKCLLGIEEEDYKNNNVKIKIFIC